MDTTCSLRFPEPSLRLQTEKVGLGLWWRSCSIFYLEVTGGSCLNKKNRSRRNAISIYTPIATPERVFFVTNPRFSRKKRKPLKFLIFFFLIERSIVDGCVHDFFLIIDSLIKCQIEVLLVVVKVPEFSSLIMLRKAVLCEHFGFRLCYLSLCALKFSFIIFV